MKRLVALAIACALVMAGGAESAAKPRGTCAKPKLAKQHRKAVRCASVRRVVTRRASRERLTAPTSTPTTRDLVDPGAPGPTEVSPAPAPIRFVSVKALEYSLTLSRPVVNAGSVKIELRNNGEDPHNLVVSPDDGSHAPLATWADTGPGAILTESVALSAGRYQLWCSLLDHEARGMTVDLVVE